MKKGFKGLISGIALAFMLTLSSCGANQKAADKINNAASEKNYYTVEKLEKSYGDPTVDFTATVLGSQNGLLVWINGCKTAEEAKQKLDDGKEVKALYVVIVNNNAVSATYEAYDPNKQN